MKILICDDMHNDAEKLDGILCACDETIKTAIFASGQEALNFMHTGVVVDLCFLDIVMPEISGIALAERMRKDGYTGDIVFVSASNEYGAEAFGVEACGYLLKPPTPESVKSVLAKLKHKRRHEDMDGILVKTAGIIKKILYRDISHVEVIRHKIFVRMTDGCEVETYATFEEIIHKLTVDPRFVRCHRSYIINMDNISEISRREIVMRDAKKIPVTRTYCDVRNQFYNWELAKREAQSHSK